MRNEYRIITFGLTEEENKIVYENLPIRKYEVFHSDNPTDLIAIESIVLIVFVPAMEQDSIDIIFNYYAEINGCINEPVIST